MAIRMRFVLEIRTDGFGTKPAEAIAHVLRDVAQQVIDCPEALFGTCYDAKGRVVGSYTERTD